MKDDSRHIRDQRNNLDWLILTFSFITFNFLLDLTRSQTRPETPGDLGNSILLGQPVRVFVTARFFLLLYNANSTVKELKQVEK